MNLCKLVVIFAALLVTAIATCSGGAPAMHNGIYKDIDISHCLQVNHLLTESIPTVRDDVRDARRTNTYIGDGYYVSFNTTAFDDGATLQPPTIWKFIVEDTRIVMREYLHSGDYCCKKQTSTYIK